MCILQNVNFKFANVNLQNAKREHLSNSLPAISEAE